MDTRTQRKAGECGRGPRSRPAGEPRRRGGVYLAVLGAAMVVCILGLSAMAVVRLEHLSSQASSDSIKARSYAESAVELGMLEIKQNALWRLRPSGDWETGKAIGDGTCSLRVTDPYDGNLGDNPRDSVVVRGTGEKGQAKHIVEVTLVDAGDPVTALTSALAAAGGLQVEGTRSLIVTGAPVTSNGTLTNDGTIVGDAAALLIVGGGTITGSSTILSLGRSMPAAGPYALYQKMGTPINPGSDMDRVVLAPKYNSYGGQKNKDGIYVVTGSGNLRIRDVRIAGTLVVIRPGSTVTIENNVLIENYRSDCPALIVHGDLVLGFDSSSALREGSGAVNYNPQGAPYGGVSDNDQTDEYPSEIRGLVHATGTVRMQNTARVVGCIVAEGAPLLAPGVTISGNVEVVHNPLIAEKPPIGYSVSPRMHERAGTWTRVTLP